MKLYLKALKIFSSKKHAIRVLKELFTVPENDRKILLESLEEKYLYPAQEIESSDGDMMPNLFIAILEKKPSLMEILLEELKENSKHEYEHLLNSIELLENELDYLNELYCKKAKAMRLKAQYEKLEKLTKNKKEKEKMKFEIDESSKDTKFYQGRIDKFLAHLKKTPPG